MLENQSLGELFRLLNSKDKKEFLNIVMNEACNSNLNLQNLVDKAVQYIPIKKEIEIRSKLINKIEVNNGL